MWQDVYSHDAWLVAWSLVGCPIVVVSIINHPLLCCFNELFISIRRRLSTALKFTVMLVIMVNFEFDYTVFSLLLSSGLLDLHTSWLISNLCALRLQVLCCKMTAWCCGVNVFFICYGSFTKKEQFYFREFFLWKADLCVLSVVSINHYSCYWLFLLRLQRVCIPYAMSLSDLNWFACRSLRLATSLPTSEFRWYAFNGEGLLAVYS